MISQNYVSPVICDSSCEKHYHMSTGLENVKHPHLHQLYLALSKIKNNLKTALFERRDHQEKRPQDGKTSPME
jgi:hypothetical protein